MKNTAMAATEEPKSDATGVTDEKVKPKSESSEGKNLDASALSEALSVSANAQVEVPVQATRLGFFGSLTHWVASFFSGLMFWRRSSDQASMQNERSSYVEGKWEAFILPETPDASDEKTDAVALAKKELGLPAPVKAVGADVEVDTTVADLVEASPGSVIKAFVADIGTPVEEKKAPSSSGAVLGLDGTRQGSETDSFPFG